MSRLRKLMEERDLDVGLLGAALNISDSEMEVSWPGFLIWM